MKLPKFDWKNIDWFSVKPSKERAIVGVVVLLAGLGLFYLGRMSSGGDTTSQGSLAGAQIGQKPSAPAAASAGISAKASDPIPLQPVTSGPCRTFAPQGWHVTDANQQGTAFTVTSPDGRMIASYGAVGVNGGAAAGYYGEQFRTPENLALYSAGVLTNEQARATRSETTFGYYQVLTFATASRFGYALLYRFPVAADPAGYGLIMRIAITGDPHSLGSAGSVAAATRCTSALVPPPADLPRPTTSSDTHDTGKSDDDDVTMAGTYNAQLGTGWVHDDAGNNYNVDVVSDYSEDGPEGPGYYKHNGNDWIKLQNGLSD
ncbi:MAG: hypothetical protein KGJ79_05885 [Alphaproteobacteria bacterium]|nr:hypothetical protein [Alphaproteobacteria bacterium]MDE2110652.1 hypothetical protein [Alphaproteobacteria bacterium]MDE2495081.1 hypothetical protein [Alphaproteobacteria bacterium]